MGEEVGFTQEEGAGTSGREKEGRGCRQVEESSRRGRTQNYTWGRGKYAKEIGILTKTRGEVSPTTIEQNVQGCCVASWSKRAGHQGMGGGGNTR